MVKLKGVKIYKPTSPNLSWPRVADNEIPWVYDQDPSSGNEASCMFVPLSNAEAYAAELVKKARKDALEEAANVCVALGEEYEDQEIYAGWAAKAIRALGDEE